MQDKVITQNEQMLKRTLERMNDLGLNPNSLAKAMGKRQSTVQTYLSGRTRTFRDVVKLAQALKTTTSWLLAGEGSPDSDKSFYDTPEFSHILTTTMLMWAERYKDGVSAERVQEIAKEVYREMREESEKAKKSSIKLLFDASLQS